MWCYYQEKGLFKRYYQIAVNYAIVEIQDGKQWIPEQTYLKTYEAMINDKAKRMNIYEEFSF
jgi:hypothetical protein